ncbi:MAG TPA: hypothetical protein VHL57_02810, partial [Flavobacteriales bacterium]|nr:hypothetical protein [Flavobacteriales bacterium]
MNATAPTAPATGAWSFIGGPVTAGITTPSSRTSGITGMTTAGVYTFRWTVSNTPCTAVTDDVIITASAAPTSAAGPDQTVCVSSPAVTLAANNPSAGTGAWTIVSGPSTNLAQFSSSSSNAATFTPAGGAGTYTLRWTVSNSPCTAAADDVAIIVNALPTSNAGSDLTACTTAGTATMNATAPTAPATGAWSFIGGPVTPGITTPSSRTSGITGMTTAGVYTFRWTVSNNPCTAATDDMTITANPAPTASNAGPDQTICSTTTSVTLAANAPAVGTASWSVVSGPSTSNAQFSSTTNEAATFTPAGGAGTYTLRWTIVNAPCTNSTNDVVIQVNAPPSASNAGVDQNICATAGTATMAAAAPGTGTGAWSFISGPVTPGITTPSSRTSGITGMTTAGVYTFRWTVSNAPCTASTDDMTITATPGTTVANAGPDHSMCFVDVSTTLAANTAVNGTGAWTIVAGSPNTSTAQLSSTSSPTATFTPTLTGTYTLRWTITNAPCATTQDDVVITVQPFAATVTQTFNSNGTFNVPAGVTQITVDAWGGGGAGGGGTNAGTLQARGGGGGGGGAFVTKVLTVTSGSTLNVVVGGSVAGTAGGNGANGNASTITGFEAQVFAAGGSAGAGNPSGGSPAGGAGGTQAASQGDIETPGGNGTSGASGLGISSGAGGAGANGGAGGPAITTGQANGNNGTAPGGGGGGARTSQNGGNTTGGNGAAGRVVISYTPTASVSATATTICSGTSTTLTATGGGTYLWSPGGQTTASIVVSPSSTTTYTVTVTNICPEQHSLQINVVPAPNAGTNGTATVCSNGAAFSLFAQLGGTPNAGGSWSGPSAVVGGNYDPATMVQGVYTYQVNGTSPCGNATATVTVTEVPAPNAGANGNTTTCSNSAAFDMATFLGAHDNG